MASVTGLTFFFSGGTFFSIHRHTATVPYAETSPESLSVHAQEYVSWIYVPVPADDQILVLAIRKPASAELGETHCVLVRGRSYKYPSVSAFANGLSAPHQARRRHLGRAVGPGTQAGLHARQTPDRAGIHPT